MKQIVLVQTTGPCEKGPKMSSVLLIDNLIVVILRKGLKKGGQWSAFLRKEYCDSLILSSDFYLTWAKFSLEVKGKNEMKILELCTAVPAKTMLWAIFCFHGDGYSLVKVSRGLDPQNQEQHLGVLWTLLDHICILENLPFHERVLWAPSLTSA